MAVGGIGSYGSYSNYYQTISQVRLEQALAKNQRYQKSIQPVESISPTENAFKSDAMDFLKSYSSTMSDVMQSANALRDSNSKSVSNDMEAVSSDSDIVDAALRYKFNTGKNVTLNVESLASAQTNSSAGVKASQAAAADMIFEVNGSKGSVSVNVSAVRDNGQARSNRDMLKDAARQINAGDTGVFASVTEKDGIAVLELKGNNTGTQSAFTVNGTMGAAQGAEITGSEARNAEYTVTNQYGTHSYTSQSNKVTVDGGRLEARLKSTGTAQISIQPDNRKIADAMSSLVSSYNEAVTFLASNASHGRGVTTQLTGLERALGDSRIADRLGITKGKDGTLSLDKDKLMKSLKEEPNLTKELISGSSGLAQTMFRRASSAMSANSASLISNDLASYHEDLATDPFQFMNLYSRQGAYQMNNYTALGLMMNYLV